VIVTPSGHTLTGAPSTRSRASSVLRPPSSVLRPPSSVLFLCRPKGARHRHPFGARPYGRTIYALSRSVRHPSSVLRPTVPPSLRPPSTVHRPPSHRPPSTAHRPTVCRPPSSVPPSSVPPSSVLFLPCPEGTRDRHPYGARPYGRTIYALTRFVRPSVLFLPCPEGTRDRHPYGARPYGRTIYALTRFVRPSALRPSFFPTETRAGDYTRHAKVEPSVLPRPR
jgi:hypothetical protein